MKRSRVTIIILIIIAMGFLGAVLGNRVSLAPPDRVKERMGKRIFPEDNAQPEHPGPFNRSEFLHRVEDMDHKGYIVAKSTVTMINISISVILIFLYINIFRKIKSDFTLGLIVVMFAFLVYAITSNPLFYSIFGYWGFGMGPFQMIPDIFTTIALGILLYLSLK